MAHWGGVATNSPTLSIRAGTIRSASVTLALFGSVGDPEGTRIVTSIIALLVAIGLALVMLAIWLFRTTRPDPELLAPLEMMGERKWRRADPVWQRRHLDEIRPRGANPMQPSIAPPTIDKAFDEGPSAAGFDDLHDARLASHDADGDEASADGTDAATDMATDTLSPSAHERVAATDTPKFLPRPTVEEFEDGDVDPDVLAAAIAELDAELGHDRP